MKYKSIACVADKTTRANASLEALKAIYKFHEPTDDTDLIIALGGDGFMLHILHQFMHKNIPIYGMNCGTVGFLMNGYAEDDLITKLEQAVLTVLHPLSMKSIGNNGDIKCALAVNEVSILRESRQTAKIRVVVDDVVRIEEMVCDGVMLSTPAGSSAYNFSVGGPIIPLGAEILALTPISPFPPRRWRGALLPNKAKVRFEVLEIEKRPVSAVADFTEFRDVAAVEVVEETSIKLKLPFNPDHSLEDRIIREQFLY